MSNRLLCLGISKLKENDSSMWVNIRVSLLVLYILSSAALVAQELEPRFVTEYNSFLFNHLDTFYCDNGLVDTLNGEVWTRVYRTEFAEGSSSNTGQLKLKGYWRTEDRRTYFSFVNQDVLGSGLMYDFNLEVGEEARVLPWVGSSSGADTTVYLVDSIKYMDCVFKDSVKVMYVRPYRSYSERRFYPFSNIWVEGIGDTQHPFPPLSCLQYTSCEAINSRSKYYLNGTWYELWNSEGTAQLPCEEITTSTRNPILNLPVKLSPNPVSHGGALNIRAENFAVEKVSLIGLADGRLVAEWGSVPSGDTDVTIPLTVPPGVYVVLLTDRAGRLVREKVVVR